MAKTIVGNVTTSLEIQSRTYRNANFGVVPGLRADIILSQKIVKEHGKIINND